MRVKKFFVFIFSVLTLLMATQHHSVKACKPGEVYDEGERFLGICWGRNGDECAKCVPAR